MSQLASPDKVVAETVDFKSLIHKSGPFTVDDVRQLDNLLATPHLAEIRQEFIALQRESSSSGKLAPDLAARLGVGLYLLGHPREAERAFSSASGNAVAAFYHGMALSALERHEQAEASFAEAAKLGYDKVEATMRRAGELRAQNKLTEAEAMLRSVVNEGARRAEYSYQMGSIRADRGDTYGAIEYFERAVDMDPRHSRALFRLAVENATRGNDSEAIRLYEQALSRPPIHLGALMNLGLMYEDDQNYRAAAFCFRRVLEVDPNNERARLYLKDIEAASDMYYDEDAARDVAKMEAILARPISDFELSVRSRNCLEAMNVNTLGDLTQVTEDELLNGRNFGETSLREVRDLLGAHGLRVGQNVGMGRMREPLFTPTAMSPQEQAVQVTPLSDLNLSVRARKCMSRLGLTTLGDLIQKTPDELLGSRNFGVTSLNEIRAKLAEINLKLRND
ncbi:MAG TPA: DNA-directed RNA polymerase subunit alpha C-terminal domain-containing protein [Planctomycetaceae bacterium]|nr:DNA-directed RNA polymerase subunit alpha C-terminal domain-containing protein [Planctomycetaceae bacterium]